MLISTVSNSKPENIQGQREGSAAKSHKLSGNSVQKFCRSRISKRLMTYKYKHFSNALRDSSAEVHNFFVFAGRITFIFMSCGRQWVQGIFIFCGASVLLPHTGA